LNSVWHLRIFSVPYCKGGIMTAHPVAAPLGGKKALKRQVLSDLDLLAAIQRGLPTRAVEEVLRSGLLEPGEV